ncbi:MAG: hypothetical protein IJV38_08015 [Prevotella sp.]|nr:hypothetical protein [Prevotella sp.]
MSVTMKTANLSGKVTGVVDCGNEETEYYVDVMMPAKGVVLKVKVKESALLSLSEYAQKVIDDMIKKTEEFRKKILRTDNPNPYGWLKGFLNPTPLKGITEETAKELTDRLIAIRSFAFPTTKDVIEEYEKKFNEYARNIMKGVDPAVPGVDKNGVSVVDGKMSKSRCVKLLESYRAERDKLKNGRKFERCLRDSVVDEALERAIELLKGGAE